MTREEAVEGPDGMHPRPGQLVYLELPAEDPERAGRFYAAAFGWAVEQNGFSAPGIIGHWVLERRPSVEHGPQLWIYVEDLERAFALVEQHGGTVLQQPTQDGPTRTLARIQDPEGQSIGLVTLTR